MCGNGKTLTSKSLYPLKMFCEVLFTVLGLNMNIL